MKNISKLYRAVSTLENEDYITQNKIRCIETSLQVKQFFLKKAEVIEYVNLSKIANFKPPYTYIWEIEIYSEMFKSINADFLKLDSFIAVSIEENNLKYFNKCVKLVKQNERINYI